jgi:anti-sigma-K factor RskA
MKMKQMPYRVEQGAIERAKYRAKMAVREAAHPTEHPSRGVQWRWASAVAVVAVLVVGVIGFVKYYDNYRQPEADLSPMDELLAEMQSAPDELIAEWTADVVYYEESDINAPI